MKDYKRISGTALGGGTFLGLCRLLTEVYHILFLVTFSLCRLLTEVVCVFFDDAVTLTLTEARSFDDAMSLAEGGDQKKVNMLVSDIYGGQEVQEVQEVQAPCLGIS